MELSYANESDQQQVERNEKEECLKAINNIEEELDSKGTSVEKELLSFYTNLEIDRQDLILNSLNSSEPVLVNGSNDIIESIEIIHNTDNLKSTSLEIYYLGLAGTIIAWFNSKGYKLSAELLDHAANNSTLNSYYYPTYGSRVKSSSVYWNKKNSSGSSGTGTFTNTGSTKEKDLYYAIHKFNWYKHAGQFIISDRYDFSNEYLSDEPDFEPSKLDKSDRKRKPIIGAIIIGIIAAIGILLWVTHAPTDVPVYEMPIQHQNCL